MPPDATTKTKKRKRRRAFGAVRTLPSKSIQATYVHQGKRYSKTFPPGTKVKVIDDYLAIVRSAIAEGKWTDPDAEPAPGSVTFREYAERWLATGVEREDIRPTTEDKYRGLLNRHLLPTFGDFRLAEITEAQVETWFYRLRAEHKSTAAGAYRLLATIFNSAKNLTQSPCTIEGAGREPTRKMHSATMAECQSAIDAIPDQYRSAIMLAAWGHLRMSEVLGLQRADIDLNAGTVSVERSWTLARESRRTTLGRTKSEAGTRTLHLPPYVVEALTEHLDNHVWPEKTAWLFPGASGMPLAHRTLSRIWDRARRTIDRADLRFHDLRVSGLTWVGQAGATGAELMYRGGHANLASVQTYQDADAQRDRALAMSLDLTPTVDPPSPKLAVVKG